MGLFFSGPWLKGCYQTPAAPVTLWPSGANEKDAVHSVAGGKAQATQYKLINAFIYTYYFVRSFYFAL